MKKDLFKIANIQNEPYILDKEKLVKVSDYFNDDEDIMVSVICNSFNHAKYIEACLNGILGQLVSFNVEILVHDDFSQDQSQEIIKQFASKYPKIVLPIFQSENMYSKHLNITKTFQLPRVRGKYIAFCECDDYWVFNMKLINQVMFLESHMDYSCTGHNSFVSKNNVISLFCTETSEKDMDTIDALEWSSNLRMHYSSFLVRTDIFKKEKPAYYYSYKGVGDRPLLIFMTENGKCRYFPFIGSCYRKFSTLSSWSFNNEKDLKGQLSIRFNLANFFGSVAEHYVGNELIFTKCNSLRNEYLYDYFLLSGRFNAIFSDKNLKDYYRHKSFRHKIFFHLAKTIPFVQNVYVKRRLK